MSKPNFTDISAGLLKNHRTEMVQMLQAEGVHIPPSASDDQLINAYLVTIQDSPSFRSKLTKFVMSGGNYNADGNSDWDNADGSIAIPTYINPNITAPTPTVNTATTTAATSGGSGFLSTLGNIFSSQAFNTVLDTAANQLNSKNTLKEQANQIKLAQVNAANNALLAQQGINPAGTTSTGMSTGAKVAIFIGVVILIGGVIYLMSKKKGSTSNVRVISSTPHRAIGAAS